MLQEHSPENGADVTTNDISSSTESFLGSNSGRCVSIPPLHRMATALAPINSHGGYSINSPRFDPYTACSREKSAGLNLSTRSLTTSSLVSHCDSSPESIVYVSPRHGMCDIIEIDRKRQVRNLNNPNQRLCSADLSRTTSISSSIHKTPSSATLLSSFSLQQHSNITRSQSFTKDCPTVRSNNKLPSGNLVNIPLSHTPTSTDCFITGTKMVEVDYAPTSASFSGTRPLQNKSHGNVLFEEGERKPFFSTRGGCLSAVRMSLNEVQQSPPQQQRKKGMANLEQNSRHKSAFRPADCNQEVSHSSQTIIAASTNNTKLLYANLQPVLRRIPISTTNTVDYSFSVVTPRRIANSTTHQSITNSSIAAVPNSKTSNNSASTGPSLNSTCEEKTSFPHFDSPLAAFSPESSMSSKTWFCVDEPIFAATNISHNQGTSSYSLLDAICRGSSDLSSLPSSAPHSFPTTASLYLPRENTSLQPQPQTPFPQATEHGVMFKQYTYNDFQHQKYSKLVHPNRSVYSASKFSRFQDNNVRRFRKAVIY